MSRSLEPRVPNVGDSSGDAPRRRPRLTLDETRRRVLDAASAAVMREGLTSGIEHIRLEDAVRDADVSRTAAYRCWGKREDFLIDLLEDIAAGAMPVDSDRGDRATAVIRDAVGTRWSRLVTVEGRREMLREAVVAAAMDDIAADREEWHRWQIFLGLTLAVPTLPRGDGRERVVAAVAAAEQEALARIEASHRILLSLFGFEPRNGYALLAETVLAVMRGLVVSSYVNDGARSDVVAHTYGSLLDGALQPVDQSRWHESTARALIDGLAVPDIFSGASPIA